MTFMKHALLLAATGAFLISGGALAKEEAGKTQPKAPPYSKGEPSKETRQQMAAMHEKMADCLNSNRPISECKSEMHESCEKMKGGCPHDSMMHQGGKGMGGEYGGESEDTE